jgi:hypothetical protein
LVGFALALGLLSTVVVSGPGYLVNFLVTIVFGSQIGPDQAMVVNSVTQALVSMVSSLLYLPLRLTAMTLVYLDLRVRSEGLDLALQAAGEDANIVTVAGTSPPPQAKFLTGTDVAYFALLTLIVVAIFSLFFGLVVGLIASSASLLGAP